MTGDKKNQNNLGKPSMNKDMGANASTKADRSTPAASGTDSHRDESQINKESGQDSYRGAGKNSEKGSESSEKSGNRNVNQTRDV